MAVKGSSKKKVLGIGAVVIFVAIVMSMAIGAIDFQNYPSIYAYKTFSKIDTGLKQKFIDSTGDPEFKYQYIFRYFITGFLLYREGPSFAVYPGARSYHGETVDKMEGFSRILPLISAWLSSGRDVTIKSLDGQAADLSEIAKAGLIAGTNPRSKGYWGEIGNNDQRICEAADIALSVWLLKDSVWRNLTKEEQSRVAAWLQSTNGKDIADNNWHLFPVLVNEILKSLGFNVNDNLTNHHYNRMKSFYVGNGWFSDGPKGIYDYYNAWSIHYSLFWINEVNPKFDPRFIREVLKEFLGGYRYFFSDRGIPIMGRSICYRMAAPVPLLSGSHLCPETVSPGMARRALDYVWKYFIENGAVRMGNVQQGYCKSDLRYLDNYSGPASCLWSLRSLVVAFYFPRKSQFWTASSEPLPIENSDYKIDIPAVGWRIEGSKATHEVTITWVKRQSNNLPVVDSYGLDRKIYSFLRQRPARPENRSIKYDLPFYSSSHPFCGCNND